MTKFVYNNNMNASTELSFFEIITSYSSRMTFEEFSDFRAKSIFAKAHVKHLNAFMQMCKKTLLTAQQHQKIFVDKHNKSIQYAIENYV